MTFSHLPLKIVKLAPSCLALFGDLDIAGVPEIEEQLAGWDGDLVLDCSGLTFIDASGLSVFVRARHACETRGTKFSLIEPSPILVRLLSITGLDEVFLTSFDELAR